MPESDRHECPSRAMTTQVSITIEQNNGKASHQAIGAE
jgi:hypothetical protein